MTPKILLLDVSDAFEIMNHTYRLDCTTYLRYVSLHLVSFLLESLRAQYLVQT